MPAAAHRNEGAPLCQIVGEISGPDITVQRSLEAGTASGHQSAAYPTPMTNVIEDSGVTSVSVAKILLRNGCEFGRKAEPATLKAEAAAPYRGRTQHSQHQPRARPQQELEPLRAPLLARQEATSIVDWLRDHRPTAGIIRAPATGALSVRLEDGNVNC